ncbi:MAG: hypothetical protein ACREGB_01025 [Candidatus Saccharimonadales bacterium]
MMKQLTPTLQRFIAGTTGVSLLALTLVTSSVSADAATKASTQATNQQARVTNIISKGDQEITRRLTALNKLSSKISGTSKLTATDKSALASEVSSEISGLTALKTKLDADTTLTDAQTDAKSIIANYRVYALIVPKIQLIRTADDQQVVEDKLSDLATKLSARISAAQTAGKDVATLQTQLA